MRFVSNSRRGRALLEELSDASTLLEKPISMQDHELRTIGVLGSSSLDPSATLRVYGKSPPWDPGGVGRPNPTA